MIENKSMRIVALLAGLYVLIGVIAFPRWYFDVLQDGGIANLVYQAQTTYLVWNILALAVIALVVFTVSSLERNHKDLYESVQKLLRGKVLLSALWVVIFVAIYRLLSVSIFFQNEGLLTLAEKVQVLEQKNKPNTEISAPIETIYVNDKKVESIYAQIAPKLELSERSVGHKNGNRSEGEIGLGDVAAISSTSEASQEKQDKYKTRKLSLSEKLVKTINFLNANNNLLKVLPITVESKELKQIDDAVSALSEFNIGVDPEQVALTKRQITNKVFQSKVSDTYKVNSWILISAPVSILKADSEEYISVSFEYVPGDKSGVDFVCNIPKADINKTELSMLLGEPKWELNIFGKIVHKSNGESIKYSVNCLSMYR